MAAEIVLQLASWDPRLRTLTKDSVNPCRVYHVDGAPEAARVLVCETQGNNGGGLALYRELSALLSRYPNRACIGPVWPACRTERLPHCRQILAINLGAQGARGLDTWVQRNWSSAFGDRAIVVPIAPSALASTLKLGRHLGAWQVAFWLSGVHEKAIDVLRVAGIGMHKSIFLSYVRKDAAALADRLWRRLGELGFDVFLDRFTATLGQRFPEEIEEKVATAEAVVLLQSPLFHTSKWVRREIAVARSVGAGVLVVSEAGSPPPSYVHADDVLQRPATVWKRPSQGHVDAIARFIGVRSAMASLRASVYCERSMRHAARRHGLNVSVLGPGLFGVDNAAIAPRGQPPTLRDLHASLMGSQGRPLAVVGEIQVLQPAARAPIEWVAHSSSIELRRRGEMAAIMRSIQRTGKP